MSFSKKGKKHNYLFLTIKQLTQSLFCWHLKMQFSIIYIVVQHLKQEKSIKPVFCSTSNPYWRVQSIYNGVSLRNYQLAGYTGLDSATSCNALSSINTLLSQ